MIGILYRLDRLLIDRVFQPILNLVQVEPVPASLFMLSGTILLQLYGVFLAWPNLADMAMSGALALGFCVLYGMIAALGENSTPFALARIGILLIWLFQATQTVLVTIYDPADTRRHTTACLSGMLYVACYYFLSCHKPPRRKRKGKLSHALGMEA